MEESIIYVDADATDGEATGESWADAYTDLQDALAVAGASDQIWVAEGTYVPTSTSDRTISFVINNGVKVYGGFVGNETALNQRDIDENETILSGNIGADTQADNSIHIVNIDGSTSSTLIDGFTVSGGQADNGGAFYSASFSSASATLSNLQIKDNFATDDGGAIYIGSGSNLVVDNVIFSNNSSGGIGGAVYIGTGSSFEVLDSLFIENEAVDGGAIYTGSSSGSPTRLNIIGNTFYNNDGGGNSDDIRDRGTTNRNISNNIFADSENIDSLKFFFNFAQDSENVSVGNNVIAGIGEFGGLFEQDISEFEGSAEDNILDEDPLFVDSEEGDFRLQRDSPGIDAGNNDVVDEDSRDVAGNPRIYGDAVDIGAYEYGLYLSIDDVRVIEGDKGTSNAEFTVTLLDALDLAPTNKVTVDYKSLDRNAKDGSDFTDVSGDFNF